MPPPAIVDPSTLDFSRLIADREQIMCVNPHRHEFMLLDGVVFCDVDKLLFAGFHDVRADAFWTRGHIPGRPLFPGVLMIEAAAQLASYMTHRLLGDERFVGFVGLDNVKFRGTVAPPCRYIIVGRAREIRPRRTVCDTQGFVNNSMVYEGTITGMAV